MAAVCFREKYTLRGVNPVDCRSSGILRVIVVAFMRSAID